MENETEIMQHVLKIQYISLLPKYIKQTSSGILTHAFNLATQVFKSLNALYCGAIRPGKLKTLHAACFSTIWDLKMWQ